MAETSMEIAEKMEFFGGYWGIIELNGRIITLSSLIPKVLMPHFLKCHVCHVFFGVVVTGTDWQ